MGGGGSPGGDGGGGLEVGGGGGDGGGGDGDGAAMEVSTLTRAMEVPGPVGASLAARAGCAGIVVMNNARGDFFDCEKLALGLHPKTALRFKSKYAKDVPVARLQSAEAWVREHKAFHLQREAHELERLRARSGAARTAAPAAGGSTSSGGAAPVVGASSATIGRSTRFSTRDD